MCELNNVALAAELKAKGNSCFGNELYLDSISYYKQALSLIEVNNEDIKQKLLLNVDAFELQSALHCNASNAWWKLAQLQWKNSNVMQKCNSNQDSSCNFADSLENCKTESSAALRLQPTNAKAAHRLTAVLLLLEDAEVALQIVDQSLQLIASKLSVESPEDSLANRGDKDSTKIDVINKYLRGLESLKKIRCEAIAAVLLSRRKREKVKDSLVINEAIGTGHKICNDDLCLSIQSTNILQALLKQYQIKITLPNDSNDSESSNEVHQEDNTSNNIVNKKSETAGTAIATTRGRNVTAASVEQADNEALAALLKKSSSITTDVKTANNNNSSSNKKQINSKHAVEKKTPGKPGKKSNKLNKNSFELDDTNGITTSSSIKISKDWTELKVIINKFDAIMHCDTKSSNSNSDAAYYSSEVIALFDKALQLLARIWSQGANLKSCFGCALDEPHVLFLIHLIIYCYNNNANCSSVGDSNNCNDDMKQQQLLVATATVAQVDDTIINAINTTKKVNTVNYTVIVKLLQQLVECERFSTVTLLAFTGRSELIKRVNHTLSAFLDDGHSHSSDTILSVNKLTALLK